MIEESTPRLAKNKEAASRARGTYVQNQPLTACLRNKIMEGVERTDHLIQLVPPDQMNWRPSQHRAGLTPPAADLGHLLGHLLDCVGGICAALVAAFPNELATFSRLRLLPVNLLCPPQEARERIASYSQCIERGFDICTDSTLARRVPTVFVPEGEELLTLLLDNFEHLTNHKYQLFFYLKTLGVPVASVDLYHWRTNSEPNPIG
jgi:DinB superfamily